MTKVRMVKLGRKGHMVLPKEIRDSLGLKEGDHLMITLQGEEVILTTPQRYAQSTRGMLKGTWGRTKQEIEDYLQRERSSWESAS